MEFNTALVIMCKIHHDSALPDCLDRQLMCYVRGLASISLGVLTSAHVCAQLRHCAAAAAIISQVNEKKKNSGVFSSSAASGSLPA